MQSLTSMHNCPHGPIKDCHKCMFKELVQVMEHFLVDYSIAYADLRGRDKAWCEYEDREVVVAARAVLEKAKLIDPDCIPYEEAKEAARR